MATANAPDEEERKLRKKELKKKRKAENWKRKSQQHGAGKISKQSAQGRLME
ncbi:MAG: hypothetical protein WED04_09380 [Promethearchaeati archaeon SRVP18_Atabeyarchaeia-1]